MKKKKSFCGNISSLHILINLYVVTIIKKKLANFPLQNRESGTFGNSEIQLQQWPATNIPRLLDLYSYSSRQLTLKCSAVQCSVVQ